MTLNIVQSLINMTFRKYSQLSWPKSYKSVTDVLSGTILILVLDPPLEWTVLLFQDCHLYSVQAALTETCLVALKPTTNNCNITRKTSILW